MIKQIFILLYWMLQGILVMTVTGFGILPQIVGITILILVFLNLIFKNKSFNKTISIGLLCLSIIICFGVIIAGLFFYTSNEIFYILLFFFSLVNIAVSFFMIKQQK